MNDYAMSFAETINEMMMFYFLLFVASVIIAAIWVIIQIWKDKHRKTHDTKTVLIKEDMTMSKAEKFIQENTKYCSNQYDFPEYFENGIKRLKEYQHWLTPDQARKAVDIAREEIYDWLANHYRDYMHNPTGRKLEAFFGIDMINDLKQSMKDE